MYMAKGSALCKICKTWFVDFHAPWIFVEVSSIEGCFNISINFNLSPISFSSVYWEVWDIFIIELFVNCHSFAETNLTKTCRGTLSKFVTQITHTNQNHILLWFCVLGKIKTLEKVSKYVSPGAARDDIRLRTHRTPSHLLVTLRLYSHCLICHSFVSQSLNIMPRTSFSTWNQSFFWPV
jgi:hypothetical protein